MTNIIIGIAVGLIIGWNLLPQPQWVKRIYDKAAARIVKWFAGLFVLLSLVSGCSAVVSQPKSTYPWKYRAMAEIALATVGADPAPQPKPAPKAGDKCPECNDPPGKCGVGRVGDGVVCRVCRTCNGDGRIDDRDLKSTGEVAEVQREIVLHMTRSTQKQWPTDWWKNSEPIFTQRGWACRAVLEPDGSIGAAYFDVVAPDGEVFNFFEPLTVEMVEHLETR